MDPINPRQGFSLDDKVAIVTGSTGGIGRAIASRLSELGAMVGITALPDHKEQACETAAALDSSGKTVRAYTLDVRSRPAIDDTLRQVHDDFGQLDVLVNNAGVRLLASSLTTDEDAWDEVTSVNLRGVFFCSQSAALQMRSRGGSIVNISSQLGLVAAKDRAAYCATKAAVNHLTRALALDWAPYRIRVNAVAPGPTHTPSTNIASSPQEAVDFLTRMPLGRPIEATEVAQAACFLAGPQSAAITGHTLVVDGGWTLP
jgi:2-deoxy-D-gluconate 3-dehydrogenase